MSTELLRDLQRVRRERDEALNTIRRMAREIERLKAGLQAGLVLASNTGLMTKAIRESCRLDHRGLKILDDCDAAAQAFVDSLASGTDTEPEALKLARIWTDACTREGEPPTECVIIDLKDADTISDVADAIIERYGGGE